jgi:hypothetical protein
MTLGWLGNILILLALYLIGCKHKIGWVCSALGNIFWCIYAIQLQMLDMFMIDFVTLIIASYNYVKWSREKINV